ncbi:Glutamate-gated chloride channel-like 16, partial [Homarus americanus]
MLIYQHEETVSYKCHFKLQLYPFDRQLCFVVYRIQDDGEGIQFLGSRQLLEYTLISETFKNYTLHDVSHIKIEFAFRNQYGYYIGNTFLPSVMLAIICWVTLHFDIADFQDRIMVSLTSLLVLATVFTQTSQSIPKTSYLKLIDVWFVVLISEDFAIIVSLVYIEVLRLRHPTNTIKVVPVGSVMAWDTVVKRIKTNVDDDEISIRELRNRRLSMNRDESSSPVPDH